MTLKIVQLKLKYVRMSKFGCFTQKCDLFLVGIEQLTGNHIMSFKPQTFFLCYLGYIIYIFYFSTNVTISSSIEHLVETTLTSVRMTVKYIEMSKFVPVNFNYYLCLSSIKKCPFDVNKCSKYPNDQVWSIQLQLWISSGQEWKMSMWRLNVLESQNLTTLHSTLNFVRAALESVTMIPW